MSRPEILTESVWTCDHALVAHGAASQATARPCSLSRHCVSRAWARWQAAPRSPGPQSRSPSPASGGEILGTERCCLARDARARLDAGGAIGSASLRQRRCLSSHRWRARRPLHRAYAPGAMRRAGVALPFVVHSARLAVDLRDARDQARSKRAGWYPLVLPVSRQLGRFGATRGFDCSAPRAGSDKSGPVSGNVLERRSRCW
jgi:hypothetical protein